MLPKSRCLQPDLSGRAQTEKLGLYPPMWGMYLATGVPSYPPQRLGRNASGSQPKRLLSTSCSTRCVVSPLAQHPDCSTAGSSRAHVTATLSRHLTAVPTDALPLCAQPRPPPQRSMRPWCRGPPPMWPCVVQRTPRVCGCPLGTSYPRAGGVHALLRASASLKNAGQATSGTSSQRVSHSMLARGPSTYPAGLPMQTAATGVPAVVVVSPAAGGLRACICHGDATAE